MKRLAVLVAITVVMALACRTWRPIETDDEFRRAESACADEDQVACGYLAESLRVSRRYERSWKLAQASCDAGTGIGCAVMGWFFMEGHGDTTTDKPRALGYLEHGCEQGISGACVDVGVLLMEGEGIAQDLDRAAWASDRACDGGHLMGCANLGYLLDDLWKGHVDQPAARKLLIATCDAGNLPACRRAGVGLLEGTGGPKDVDAGMAILAETCARRDARACMALGNVSSNEWSTWPRGTREYRLACSFDSRFGCASLAEHLMAVDAGPDQWEALDAAETACGHRRQSGCSILADLLLREGFVPDRPRAQALAEASCDAGERYGCMVRARLDDGGVSWLRRAVDLGHRPAVALYLSRLDGEPRRAEAARLCDAGRTAACSMRDGGQW